MINTSYKSPSLLRQDIRTEIFTGTTSGLCRGHVQCNLVILEEKWAEEFDSFCKLNIKPCPIVYKSKPGEFKMNYLGVGIDIRTDLSKYRIFKNGNISSEVTNIASLWSQNYVSFLLGCSFSFEEALLENNIEIRNITENVNVPMYKTNIECVRTKNFFGKMVVSMRPFKQNDIPLVKKITGQFPNVHGEPIHVGDPKQIGIFDLDAPDFGDRVTVKSDELPVFWACGVTPQVAIQNAAPPICITHSPGCMLVTDKLNHELKG